MPTKKKAKSNFAVSFCSDPEFEDASTTRSGRRFSSAPPSAFESSSRPFPAAGLSNELVQANAASQSDEVNPLFYDTGRSARLHVSSTIVVASNDSTVVSLELDDSLGRGVGLISDPGAVNLPSLPCTHHARDNAFQEIPLPAALNQGRPVLPAATSFPMATDQRAAATSNGFRKSWSSLFSSLPCNAGVYTPIDFDIVVENGIMIPLPCVLQAGADFWSGYLVAM